MGYKRQFFGSRMISNASVAWHGNKSNFSIFAERDLLTRVDPAPHARVVQASCGRRPRTMSRCCGPYFDRLCWAECSLYWLCWMQPVMAIFAELPARLLDFFLPPRQRNQGSDSICTAGMHTKSSSPAQRNWRHLAGIIPPSSIFMAVWPCEQTKAGNQSKACASKSHMHVDFTTFIFHNPRACQQHHLSFGASCSMLHTCGHHFQINLWPNVLLHGSKLRWQFSWLFELELHGCKCASIS